MMKLAVWQGAGVPDDLDITVAEVARVAEMAAGQGADLLVFPEGFLTGYHIPGLTAGDLPGVEDALAEIGRIAARTRLTLVMGTHLDAPEGLRNAAVVFSADGAELGRYHKRALFGGWEQATFRPGAGTLRFDCGGLRVGVAICYDVEFPELIRAEAQAGCDLVVVPTALMAPHDRIARQVVPVRAMENQIFVAYANRSGHEPGLDFVGLSCICGPEGEILTRAGEGAELLLAKIDRATITRARAEACYVDDLRSVEEAGR
ncbi:carbon-nitrogen hydrolase family protein [Citreimonas sp.]|uniref:carbon-nitrogen hydrolase family protein n=1 Tax=Citreimonas sp. TaxID=3036715 RepID=UPI0035C86F7C